MSLGDSIKKYRKEKKITQKELAKLINASEISIRKYESGDRTPSMEMLIKIAKALNVPVQKLTETSSQSSKLLDLFAGAGMYIDPKSDLSLLLDNNNNYKFSEDEIIQMLIDCYNDDIFNQKYDTSLITSKQIEELKPIIQGIIKIVLKDCIKKENDK